MHDKFSLPDPPMRATPSAEHRRQMIWQVWVPLFASLLVVLALATLAAVGAAQGSPQVDHWGAISAVVVIIPVLISSLITLLIVSAIAYGIFRLNKKMPEWMLKAQLFMLHLALTIRRAADAATKPVVGASTFSARIRALWNGLFHRRTAP